MNKLKAPSRVASSEFVRLLVAIKTCRRLKDQPLDVKRVGYTDRYEYCPQLDAGQVEYNIARGIIQRHPLVERLIKRWV